MKNQFIPYEQALKLKELGFDEDCFGFYYMGEFGLWEEGDFCSNSDKVFDNVSCSSPLWQQAFDWFWSEHNLFSKINIYDVEENTYLYEILFKKDGQYIDDIVDMGTFFSLPDARFACLDKLIEITRIDE